MVSSQPIHTMEEEDEFDCSFDMEESTVMMAEQISTKRIKPQLHILNSDLSTSPLSSPILPSPESASSNLLSRRTLQLAPLHMPSINLETSNLTRSSSTTSTSSNGSYSSALFSPLDSPRDGLVTPITPSSFSESGSYFINRPVSGTTSPVQEQGQLFHPTSVDCTN